MLPAVFFMSALTVAAQDLSVTNVTVETHRGTPSDPSNPIPVDRILLEFNRPIATVAKPGEATELSILSNPGIYTILKRNPFTGDAPEVIKVLEVSAHCCIKDYLYLFPDKQLPPMDAAGHLFQYIFIIDDNTGKMFKKPITVVINKLLNLSLEVNSAVKEEQKKLEQKKISNEATFDIRPSKGRDDSNVYLAGELTGATDAKPNFSADIKISIPFVARRPATKIFFDLKANSNKEADPDSLDLGVEYGRVHTFNFNDSTPTQNQGSFKCVKNDTCADLTTQPDRWLSQVNYALYAKIESNREFDNTNILGGGNVTLPFNRNTRSSRTEFNLFLGVDAGKNMKSPVMIAEGKGILRPYAGISTYIGFLRKKDFFPLSFEGTYTQRWLLARELKLKKDDDGNLIAVFFDKQPRFYIETKFNFQFNRFFGFYAGYEYGEKPPDYKLIKNSFKIGLVYKFKFKDAGED
jgi:hypothetical protein